MNNIFGDFLRAVSFGESHGQALGCIIDGMPSGIPVQMELLRKELKRRAPGHSKYLDQSKRLEPDEPEILSGVFEGVTLGSPICIIVRNQDARSEDYSPNLSRPGHADEVWKKKFEKVDPRGGGRSSGRETLTRVIAGSFAQMLLKPLYPNYKIISFTKSLGNLELDTAEIADAINLDPEKIDAYPARFPSEKHHAKVHELLIKAKEEGESIGGKLFLVMGNPPEGFGEPVARKIKSLLARSIFSVGGTSYCKIGLWTEEHLNSGKVFHAHEKHWGGILGGISTGAPIFLEIYFKPPASLGDIKKKGRHDPILVGRAAPVIENMIHFTMADLLLSKCLNNFSHFQILRQHNKI